MENDNNNMEQAGIETESASEKVSRKRERNMKALYARRAVEDLLERRRFLQEANYMYDDVLMDFAE